MMGGTPYEANDFDRKNPGVAFCATVGCPLCWWDIR